MKKKINYKALYFIAVLLLFGYSGNFAFGQVDTIVGVQKKVIPPPPPPTHSPSTGVFFGSIKEEMPVWKTCKNEVKNKQRQCSNEAIIKFIYEHLQYPEEALLNNEMRTPVVTFFIEKDGAVAASTLRLVRDPGFGMGEEALRIIKLLVSEGPKWIPGMQRGRPVRIQYNIPVKFNLENLLIGKWRMLKAYEADDDVTAKHNPKNNRWMRFSKDGSFESGGDPYVFNTGKWTIDDKKSILYINSDADDDDSEWTISFKANQTVWTGIGSPRKERFQLIHEKVGVLDD